MQSIFHKTNKLGNRKPIRETSVKLLKQMTYKKYLSTDSLYDYYAAVFRGKLSFIKNR